MPLDFPVITKVIVPWESKIINIGQAIVISAEIRNGGNPFGRPLYTALQKVAIDIINPDGKLIVVDGTMEQISPGLWGYRHVPADTDILGYHTCNLTVFANNESTARLINIGIFKLLQGGLIAPFDYFGIKDQEGNIWYWWINAVPEINSDTSSPVFQFKTARDISLDVIPYWIQITNPAGEIRYVHPALSGEFIVTAVQPSVGFGIVGSPEFVSTVNDTYTIGLNDADEVVLVNV